MLADTQFISKSLFEGAQYGLHTPVCHIQPGSYRFIFRLSEMCYRKTVRNVEVLKRVSNGASTGITKAGGPHIL